VPKPVDLSIRIDMDHWRVHYVQCLSCDFVVECLSEQDASQESHRHIDGYVDHRVIVHQGIVIEKRVIEEQG
jgi:hypothetical protein